MEIVVYTIVVDRKGNDMKVIVKFENLQTEYVSRSRLQDACMCCIFGNMAEREIVADCLEHYNYIARLLDTCSRVTNSVTGDKKC